MGDHLGEGPRPPRPCDAYWAKCSHPCGVNVGQPPNFGRVGSSSGHGDAVALYTHVCCMQHGSAFWCTAFWCTAPVAVTVDVERIHCALEHAACNSDMHDGIMAPLLVECLNLPWSSLLATCTVE